MAKGKEGKEPKREERRESKMPPAMQKQMEKREPMMNKGGKVKGKC